MTVATYSTSVPLPKRMVAILTAEVRKARSFPAIPRVILVGFVVILLGAFFGLMQIQGFQDSGRAEVLNGMTGVDWSMKLMHFGQVVPILIGAWAVGQDLPSGARRTAFLATANRGALIGVKYLVAAGLALIVGLVSSFASLLPLMVSGGSSVEPTVSLAPYGWLVGYWAVIAMVAAALTAALRSVALAAVPVLIWVLGFSDLLVARLPFLTGAVDQVFKSAYLGLGATPASSDLIAAGIQVVVAAAIGIVLYMRRDAQ